MRHHLRLPFAWAVLALVAGIACGSNESTAPVEGPSLSKGQEMQCDTILITPFVATIPVGGTVQLSAHPYNGHGKELDKATVAWSVFSQLPVVAVSSGGLVTGLATGSNIVRATCSATAGVGDAVINVQ